MRGNINNTEELWIKTGAVLCSRCHGFPTARDIKQKGMEKCKDGHVCSDCLMGDPEKDRERYRERIFSGLLSTSISFFEDEETGPSITRRESGNIPYKPKKKTATVDKRKNSG